MSRQLLRRAVSYHVRLTSNSRRLILPAVVTTNAAAPFSSTPPQVSSPDLQQQLLQRLCWEAYLASGRGSDTLFKSIDVDMSGYISRENLLLFLDSIEGKGVNPKAFKVSAVGTLFKGHTVCQPPTLTLYSRK